MAHPGSIRVGIGGWSYEPWRETFYPSDVPKKSELHYASRQLTAIEINSTFYRLQSPAVYAKWRDETPEGFRFTIKAPRYITYRRTLKDCGESLTRFVASGIDELGEKLGPILWQLPPSTRFDAEDLTRFFESLPAQAGTQSVRHALEVRHHSFECAEYIELAGRFGVSSVFADSTQHPSFADISGELIYARLRQSVTTESTGYSLSALEAWAQRAASWARGEEPTDLPRVKGDQPAIGASRDVYIFFISGAKERNPAAARQLMSLLDKH